MVKTLSNFQFIYTLKLCYLQEVHYRCHVQCGYRSLPCYWQEIIFPLLFPLSLIVVSTSSVSRNCSSHPSCWIHFVILAISFGLFIMDSNDRFSAFLSISPLPMAQLVKAMIICFTFWDGYPHWHRGLSTPGTFLLCRQELNPMCSLLICMAMLLWALLRCLWILEGVPLWLIPVFPVFSSV